MIVAVTGTGTEIGKTHVACALVGAIVDRGIRAVAWKPVESGVVGDVGSDEAALAAAAGASAGVPTLRLRRPVSPHLAARDEGVAIDAAGLRGRLGELAARWDVVVLELAGGLFSPFDETVDNAEWLAAGPSAKTVLVAPDRLGVLHDIGATVRAARGLGLAFEAIALVAPASGDASTSTNARELRARATTRELAVCEVPRAPVDVLRRHASIVELANRLV